MFSARAERGSNGGLDMRSPTPFIACVLALAACKRPAPVEAPAAPAARMPSNEQDSGLAEQHAMAAAAPADVGPIHVAKAQGSDAVTVAEVHAQKGALKGKQVTLQAQVVKVNAGILGRNWVHLRDGTGSAGAHDNDLTVTTLDEAKVGEVVVAKGTVRLDRDIGSGYVFPLLLEDSKLSPAAK
jgi:hypothetical protein